MADTSLEDRFSQEQARLNAAERAARETRIAAGMGFWRLALVVAVGILIAKVATVAALGIVKLIGPPAP